MKKIIINLFLLFITLNPIYSQTEKIVNNPGLTLYDVCPLKEVLNKLGQTEKDIGYNPKAYWMSYPLPSQMPYSLPVFSDLFSEPDKIFPYVRQAASEVERFLDKDSIWNNPQAIYKLSFYLGIDRIYFGFRSYGSNFDDRWFPRERKEWEDKRDSIKENNDPLEIALDKTEEISLKWKIFSKDDMNYETWIKEKEKWIEFKKTLNPTEQKFYAFILLNLALSYEQAMTAYQFADTANIKNYLNAKDKDSDESLRMREKILSNCGGIDKASLWYAALKTSELSGYILNLIKENTGIISSVKKSWKLYTPIGWFKIGSKENNVYESKENTLFILDWGGDDKYTNAACSNPNQLISLCMDLEGNDTYIAGKDDRICSSLLGVSLLIDCKGSDTYKVETEGLGWSDMGFSSLFDLEGNDTYWCRTRGIGASYTGAGLLFDASGDDHYWLAAEGEGYGAYGGVGVLADSKGNDDYYAEPYADKSGLPGDYHSGGLIIGNQAMGAGWGRRADMDDGHCYGGGVGFLIDLQGDDSYYAGNWSMGVGYWLGMGFLYDGRGNDIYKSCYFTQASGAHYAIGAMIDEGGDDTYILWGDEKTVGAYGWAGAGLSFGWDYTVSLLYNYGGNDYYEAKKIAIGSSEIRSNSFLIDIGGDDTYKFPEGDVGMGATDVQPNYDMPFYSYAKSFGIFMDIGGNDNYINWNYRDSLETPSAIWKNNSEWRKPNDTKFNCYGIGVDWEKK